MKLLTPNSPIWPMLSLKANPVQDYAAQVKPHLNEMHRIMVSKKAVGLAAPQIGIGLRFFIYRKTTRDLYVIVVNPSITWSSQDIRGDIEGCLSFPGKTTAVRRPESIRVEYTNAIGEPVKRLLGGMEARIFQHEFDHLEGKTIFPVDVVSQYQQDVETLKAAGF